MKFSFYLFCVLCTASVLSYRLDEENNDIELTEEDVHNLIKAHQISQKEDSSKGNEELESFDENEDNDDTKAENDVEGEEISEDYVRELLQHYMKSQQDESDEPDDDNEPAQNEEEFQDESIDEKTDSLNAEDENSGGEVELLNELDETLDEEELDMLAGRLKDPKAWGRFRFRLPRFRLPRIRLPRFRFPRFRFPRIRFPRIRIRLPRIRFPRIRLPRIRLPRIRFPRIRFPRIRFPRIRWPRIRIPRLRLRFLIPKKPTQPEQPNPCPYTGDQILKSITNIKCDGHWKKIFAEPNVNALIDTNEFFLNACKAQTLCLGCMNGNPWNKAQCNNKLKSTLRNFCSGLADGDNDVRDWCYGKVDEIVKYETGKASPAALYYCKCGSDVTDVANPAKN